MFVICLINHYNAPAHSYSIAITKEHEMHFKLMPHSSDFSPRDSQLFANMKKMPVIDEMNALKVSSSRNAAVPCSIKSIVLFR